MPETETATLEDLAEGQPAAPDSPGLPRPDESQAGGEQDAGAGGEDQAEQLRQRVAELGLTAESLAAILDVMSDEERAKIPHLQAAEARGANKALTQKGDAEKAQRDREEAYQVAVDQGKRADGLLTRTILQQADLVRQADAETDPERAAELRGKAAKLTGSREFASAVQEYAAGQVADAALKRSGRIAEVREKHKDVLGELSDDEEDLLRKARYEDARTDGDRQWETLVEIALSRGAARGEAKGAEKGQKTAADTAKAIETLERLGELLKGAPPRVNGARPHTAAGGRAQIMAEIEALDVRDPQYDEKSATLRARLRALPKE